MKKLDLPFTIFVLVAAIIIFVWINNKLNTFTADPICRYERESGLDSATNLKAYRDTFFNCEDFKEITFNGS